MEKTGNESNSKNQSKSDSKDISIDQDKSGNAFYSMDETVNESSKS